MADSHVLVLIKGVWNAACPGSPSVLGYEGATLLAYQMARLRRMLPRGTLAYVAPHHEDPAIAIATAHAAAVLVRNSTSFAGALRGMVRAAEAVCVIPAAAPFLLRQPVLEALAHLRQGVDAVYCSDAAHGMGPELVLAPHVLDALDDEAIAATFFATLHARNPSMHVVEHASAHGPLLRELLGSLRVEDRCDLQRVEARLQTAGIRPFDEETLTAHLHNEHHRHREAMAQAMATGPEARLPALNHRLAMLEHWCGNSRLHSFPVELCLNSIDACNARCVFCGYHGAASRGQSIRLEDLQQLDWLRFVRTLMLHGGYGEPLLHPQFAEMTTWLRNTFPFLEIGAPTNAGLLHGPRLDAVLANLNLLRISLNAATAQTHARLMPPLAWDKVLHNIRTLVTRRNSEGRPLRIGLNYVLYSDNAAELPQLPALAAALGVDFVTVDHCTMDVSPLVDWSQSLREMPDASNALLQQTAAACRDAGLQCELPSPFTKGPLRKHPDYCHNPWTHLFMTHEGATYICCEMDPQALPFPAFQWLPAQSFLEDVWNAPPLRSLRRALAKGSGWPAPCRLCKTTDCNTLATGFGMQQHNRQGTSPCDC